MVKTIFMFHFLLVLMEQCFTEGHYNHLSAQSQV